MQVDAHGNLLHLLEALYLDDRNGVVVVWGHVAAGVCHVDVLPQHAQLIGLIAHRALGHGLQSEGVYLVNGPPDGIGIVELHGAHIRGGIGIALVETDVPHVGYVHLPYPAGRAGIKDFYLVGTVDHHIEPGPIHLYVVAHIAQFLDYGGVALGIEVAHVVALHKVHIVERTLVAAHVSFIKQIHALHALPRHGMFGDEVVLRGHHHLVFAARLPRECGRQGKQPHQCLVFFSFHTVPPIIQGSPSTSSCAWAWDS